jgi:hypothetical protein
MELGAFASSYIPTTTGSVMRNADVLTADVANWPANNFTIYLQQYSATNPIEDTYRQYVAKWFNGDNFESFYSINGNVRMERQVTGSGIVIDAGAGTEYGSHKLAGSFSSTAGITFSRDGAIVGTNGAANGTGGGTTFEIGCRQSAGHMYGNIKDLKIWGTVFSDAQLQAETT